jgi:TonB-dependent SusC/RagA subfamily outer membrane receptor
LLNCQKRKVAEWKYKKIKFLIEFDNKLYFRAKLNLKMQAKHQILKIVLITILALSSLYAHGQKLLDSRQSAYYTYIYKLTDKEAQKIYKHNIWQVDSSFLHTLADSFPTDKQYPDRLAQGHYLRVSAEKNKLKFQITSVQDFEVYIFNNQTDLLIQAYDLQGNIIPDARVSIGWKNLRFNEKTQAYTDKKSNRKGLLKVTHKGFTAYYNLSRQYNNSLIKRGSRKLVYGTPVKYVWIPVRYAVSLPVDGIKSILHGWPQGTIYRTRNFFVKTYDKVACLFNDYYCNYSNNKFKQKHTGYMVFNKPKYLPGDTVKFKVFLLSKKGRAIHKPAKLVLQTPRKNIELTTLQPYRKGGYAYEFILHDSLQLDLDRNYTLSLQLNERKEYISGSFKYEDYELLKSKLSLRLEQQTHYQGQPLKLYAKGTDENKLQLMDARLELLVKPLSISQYFSRQTFVPDTLLFLNKKLEARAETEVIIPDSLFPRINFEYELHAKLLTSDNEVISEKRKVNYYYSLQAFDIALQADSLHFTFSKNGVPGHKKASILATDHFGNETPVYAGTTPFSLALDPYFASYTIQSDSLSKRIDIPSQPSLLQSYSERDKDSVHIVVDNPRKIPFVYHIYQKNLQKAAGYTDSLSVKRKTNSRQDYFVSISYLWGGKVKEESYRIPLKEKSLHISVTQPKMVYPGQKTKIELLVTDMEGKPVPGVDVTAYSLTSKFNYSAPTLPYLGKTRKSKALINNFHFKDFNLGSHPGLQLDYQAWKILAGLDSIEYYKFIYPEDSVYRFAYQTQEALTQFAPFVVSEGAVQPVHVIYVDHKPVYFSWSTHAQPYSFAIDSGYHQIKLRTSDKHITIDSLYFPEGQKLIFSVDSDLKHRQLSIEKAKAELSLHEQGLLYRYIFPYRNTFGERYAYIEQGDAVQFLQGTQAAAYQPYHRLNLAGPVSGQVSFQLMDGFSSRFMHEPFFEYEFSPGLLKMRSLDAKKYYPRYLSPHLNEQSLSDTILSKAALASHWKNYLEAKRIAAAHYDYPQATSEGAGKLFFTLSKNDTLPALAPLNILLFTYDDHHFRRVYPGHTSLMHQLNEGHYQLVLFYPGARYQLADSIHIQANGLNYYQIQQEPLRKDAFSLQLSRILEKELFHKSITSHTEKKVSHQTQWNVQERFKYIGEGDVLEGYVYDPSGEPLPGVSVHVKGTSYGTLTDLDGYYSLKVPANSQALRFSFIGYLSEEMIIGSEHIINVTLKEDVKQLQEVVVVGYGAQQKSEMTASISTLSAQSLQGRAAGVSISTNTGAPGNAASIHIRGLSAIESSAAPLYVINGMVYTGDIAELSPDIIQSIQMLEGEEATAIYGARAANGVVIIETKEGAFKANLAQMPAIPEEDDLFFEGASEASSIRNHFADYGFWEPALVTDREGKASFELSFPDDVTSWETYYLAMNDRRQSGQSKGLIKSYKPLMAQLAVPRFLVQSDTTHAIGKVLNYLPDSIKLSTRFELNGHIQSTRDRYCSTALIDSLPIIAPADSIAVKYSLEKEDGYFDGELRSIPVYPKGLEEAKGNFLVLNKDTTFQLSFDSSLGPVKLYARADVLEVIEEEISHLMDYKYYCNEQIASKLKALLAEKTIAAYKGEKFKSERQVDKMIRLLIRNQKDRGLWGWWKNAEESSWISLHVVEALLQAEKAGYDSNLNKGQLSEKLIWELENQRDFSTRIRILRLLQILSPQTNQQAYVAELEKKYKPRSLHALLQMMELKQLYKLPYQADSLQAYQQQSIFGNIYYADKDPGSNLLNNDIQNTLSAYRILRAGSNSHKNGETLLRIRNYLLEKRNSGHWTNTYESAQVIETILPDLLADKATLSKPVLTLSAGFGQTVSEFPFEKEIDAAQAVEISKTGDFPVYLTSYQTYWNPAPKEKKNDFEIFSRFENDSAAYLKAGREVRLIAHVKVKKDAEYVMINIPVPAGCSYADKKTNFRNESHREYFRNETSIFCESLKQGEYTFEVALIPRFSGTYTINPASISLMYFPTFNANDQTKTIRIQ